MDVKTSSVQNDISEAQQTYIVTKTTTSSQEMKQNGTSSILQTLEAPIQNGTRNSGLLKSLNAESILANGHTIISERRVVLQTTVSKTERTQELPTLPVEVKTDETSPQEVISEVVVPKILNSAEFQTRSETDYSHTVANTHVNGPEQVIPTDVLSTTKPNGQVKLNIGAKGFAANDPISVPGLLHRTAETYPDVTALATKNKSGLWDTISFKQYEDLVRTCAKAFLKLGLKKHHSVCILGFNTPQWFISDLAAIYAGGFAAGIYTTNSPEACLYCAESSRANIVVVEDKKQLDKILQIRSKLPDLKAIVQYEGTPEVEGVLSWDDVMKLGREEPDTDLENALKSMAVNECCTLVYTSGTVGNPKAVMLSHDNLTWTANCVAARLNLHEGSEVIVSYLPLSHVAAQVMDIYVTLTYAVTVYFANKDALKGSLVQTLQDVRPTHFLGVPRVWEKISEKMIHIGSQTGGLKKAIASWAKSHGLQHNMDKMNGVNSNSFRYMLASMLIFRRIKKVLGFDRCRNFFSAAAPLSVDVKKYFMSLDIPIMEVFGMSESSGPHTIALSDDFRLESIGKTLPGLRTVIHNPDENGEGELCMGGRHVCMGYLNDTEKTCEALDNEGLLHSGDIGKMDKDGFVYITGRIKEIIITAGGENIPPVLIEHVVMGELPCLSNAMLIGDKRKFLSILLTLKTEIDSETGEPLDELSQIAKSWCKDVNSSSQTVSDIINGPDEKVMAAVQQGIDRVNTKAISNAQRIQKFTILPKDFSISTGEMGPTMKLKRNVVSAKYSEIIERFYKET